MKKILAILLSLLTLLSCGLLSACSAKKTQPDTPDTETVWETVSEAYIYAFPLVLTDATKTLSTNTDGTMTGRAPINQFNHAKKLADASFRTVVTPNVDTVYSQAWLDISAEPMVYVLPETDRFCNVQLLDAWTNTAAVLDKAGAYAIALPGWEGELPDGVTRVDVPTATMWSITRTVLSGNEDLPNVYAIQEQMQLLPLSAYVQGGEYAAPQGAYKEENDFVPVNKVLSMTPAEFFNTANALMQVNPPADADKELLKKLSAINVGAGKTFDAALLGEGAAERWTQMLQGLRATLAADGANETPVYQMLEDFKNHPAVAPIIRGAKLVEHSGHMVPEGGYGMVPKYVFDGCLVAGESAGLCMNMGYQVRGMDFAVASGQMAGQAAVRALDAGDTSEAGLASYKEAMEGSFVIQDLRTFSKWPHVMEGWDRMFTEYPAMARDVFNAMFSVDGKPQKPLMKRMMPIVKQRGLFKLAGGALHAADALARGVHELPERLGVDPLDGRPRIGILRDGVL